MTDLEITRLCAEAMGNLPQMIVHDGQWRFGFNNNCMGPAYDPLHDDAQAMALVKKFRLHVQRDPWLSPPWRVGYFTAGIGWRETENLDLNRAICECVAKMQAAK